MKFFIFDDEGSWTSGAYRLQEMEGHDVRMFSAKEEGREHLKGIIKQVISMEEGLRWMGRDGRFICGDESDCTPLRRRGFKGYGANAFLKKMENDRVFEMTVAKKAGLKIPNFHPIKSVDEGIKFIKSHPDQYALKQLGHAPKTWSYVGHNEDGSDIIDQLEWIKTQPEFKKMSIVPFMLQEFIEGFELATAAWWMGDDWKRDDHGNVIVEVNREHKKEGDGDTGRTTGEMGTVMQFSTDHTKLFRETVEKLTPVLKKECADVSLCIDANCGITDDGEAYLMEFTPREGYPACALEQYLLNTGTGDFFLDLIEGQQGQVEWKKEWGVITVVGAGEFPSEGKNHEGSLRGQPVEMELSEHIAPFYVSWDEKRDFFRVADWYEYIAGISYHGDDIIATNERCVKAMEKIVVRAAHYRHDIGHKFAKEELPKLKKLGYL